MSSPTVGMSTSSPRRAAPQHGFKLGEKKTQAKKRQQLTIMLPANLSPLETQGKNSRAFKWGCVLARVHASPARDTRVQLYVLYI